MITHGKKEKTKRWLVDCTTTDMRLRNSNHQNTIISGKPCRLKLHTKTSAERNCRSANSTNGQGTRVCIQLERKNSIYIHIIHTYINITHTQTLDRVIVLHTFITHRNTFRRIAKHIQLEHMYSNTAMNQPSQSYSLNQCENVHHHTHISHDSNEPKNHVKIYFYVMLSLQRSHYGERERVCRYVELRQLFLVGPSNRIYAQSSVK